jgi:uncharacterized protein (TIGR02145 family)
MKLLKLLLSFLSLLLLFGCSYNNSYNNSEVNSENKVVPLAPSNLTGEWNPSLIKLSWTTNSTNELGFKIERKIGIGTYSIIGTTVKNITNFTNELEQNTTYTFRVYAYNAIGNSTFSNEVSFTTPKIISPPTLTTTKISDITTINASSGGNITSDGGASIIARGVVWSTSSNPDISLSTKTTDGTGTGNFTSAITGLKYGKTYFTRAYATNSVGTNYGNEVSFTIPILKITDIDGNIYEATNICDQIWTTSNLNVSKYRNGDLIPQVSDPTEWITLTTGAWCYYNNDSANGPIYGKLYNWYAVVDPRGLAPEGYHIPSADEWTTLTNCLGGEAVAGGKMKEMGLKNWESPNKDATNSSGFSALPGGYRFGECGYNVGCSDKGKFYIIGRYAYWWSTTEYPTTYLAKYVFGIRLSYFDSKALLFTNLVRPGFSVRCIKD